MQRISNNAALLCGNDEYDKLNDLKRLPPFSDIVCKFINRLSEIILKHSETRIYPDVVTFGFFCRRANIEKLKKSYIDHISDRVGRGVAFHIAPSNVPINFAYSIIAALLAGNINIVRVSEKNFRQVELVCQCIDAALKEYKSLRDYISVVRYTKEKSFNDYFSSLADIRIIWGGDNTIGEIRKSFLPPRAFDITFADRYSIAVFNAEKYLEIENKNKIAENFYNDTYLYDQNACSSPRLIYWLGNYNIINDAKKIFWDYMNKLLIKKYTLETVLAVDKYTAACRMAIDKNVKIIKTENNLISRIEINKLFKNLNDYSCAGGSFIEYSDTTIDALANIVGPKYQTLSYIGMERKTLLDFVVNNGLTGIDRIVPVGSSSDFSLIWDGYDLILHMSRIVSSVG